MSNKSRKHTRKQNKNKRAPQNPNKKQFEKMTDETIEACLERMKEAGYKPVRRIEKPIFKEVITNGEKELVPDDQRIIFEGILNKGER